MLRTVLCACVAYAFYAQSVPPSAKAQVRIEGAGIKKAWGSIKGTYIDPKTRQLRVIFESADGTVRVVFLDVDEKMTVASIVSEMKRE